MQRPPKDGDIRVTLDIACDTFDQLRRFAIANGIADTGAGIIRWAAVTALLHLKAGTPAPPPTLRRPPSPIPLPTPDAAQPQPAVPTFTELPSPGVAGPVPAPTPPTPLPPGVARLLQVAAQEALTETLT